MRLYLLTALLASLLLANLVSAGGDVADCRSSSRNGKGNFDIIQAINNFCGPTWDLMVPSPKAKLGAFSNNMRMRVNINGGTCKGPSWVPRKYCISQFYHVCAVSVRQGIGGSGQLGYGPGGCQRFIISQY